MLTRVYCFLSTISQHYMHLLPAWDCSEEHNKPSSHSSAGRVLYFGHFAFMPPIATYFATNCYLFCQHNACMLPAGTDICQLLCQLLCRQIRLKPILLSRWACCPLTPLLPTPPPYTCNMSDLGMVTYTCIMGEPAEQGLHCTD